MFSWQAASEKVLKDRKVPILNSKLCVGASVFHPLFVKPLSTDIWIIQALKMHLNQTEKPKHWKWPGCRTGLKMREISKRQPVSKKNFQRASEPWRTDTQDHYNESERKSVSLKAKFKEMLGGSMPSKQDSKNFNGVFMLAASTTWCAVKLYACHHIWDTLASHAPDYKNQAAAAELRVQSVSGFITILMLLQHWSSEIYRYTLGHVATVWKLETISVLMWWNCQCVFLCLPTP